MKTEVTFQISNFKQNMITRIEINGFKTFHDFKLDLSPFQVIVGPNGAGKSNLFDALRMLSSLTDSDLRTAFHDLRGEAGELFSMFPDGRSSDRMQLAVEMLVERQAQDNWGAEADLKHTRLRYELEIARRSDKRGIERLYVDKESLLPIRQEDDAWIKRYNLSQKNRMPNLTEERNEPFISTFRKGKTKGIKLHTDGREGKRVIVAERVKRTVLSGINNVEFPHAFAAHEEMRSWKFLHINPEVLRQPSSMLAQPFIDSDGSNLPTALARMQSEDPFILNDVSRDLANLVPGVLKVDVEEERSRDQYLVRIHTQDGCSFSSRVISDGTLRALTLVSLKNDPEHRGVLCFEEPENGVHPLRLRNLVGVLKELSTDFSDPEQTDEPLRQLLVNTHSPVLVAQKEEVWPNILFAYMTTQVAVHGQPHRITRIIPVESGVQTKLDLGIDEQEEKYTLDQVKHYIEQVKP
ncbi:AAA family ATPase [Desulfobacterales bacterium HSG2]|nr:AAA family ATPase [Desulfobacterales bacterium HSG2]